MNNEDKKIPFFLLIFCALAIIVCNGCKDGHRDGYIVGLEQGRAEGRVEGWKEAQKQGMDEGRKEGKRKGLEDVGHGKAIQLYYPFMLYSFMSALLLGISLQLFLKYHLKRKKNIRDMHRLFIPGIQYTRSYRFLEEFYDTYYNTLLNDLIKVVFKLVSSKMDVERKKIELRDSRDLFQDKVESKDNLNDLLNEKLMEEASKEFDRIVESVENYSDKKEEKNG